MRIFFDGQNFDSRAWGGGGRYFFEVILRLAAMPGCEVEMFAGAYRTPLPLEQLKGRCRRFSGFRPPRLGPLSGWLEAGVKCWGEWRLDHSGADIYHPTYYQPLESTRRIPQVTTIFDLIHEQQPQYFQGNPTAGNRRRALSGVAAAVCISEWTRAQAVEVYPEIADRTCVIPLASSLRLPDVMPPASNGGRPYFLFVGNRHLYKNFRVMIAACRAIPRFAERYSLLCYGGRPFTEAEQRELAASGLQDCVQQLAGGDETLAALYHHAICFVYPSTEEGFGIPLLEAMNCGCPVLASRIAVFEEVAGEAAAYFDPASGEELAALMQKMVDDPAARQALIRAGAERTKLFSWERCAREHFELYQRIAGR